MLDVEAQNIRHDHHELSRRKLDVVNTFLLFSAPTFISRDPDIFGSNHISVVQVNSMYETCECVKGVVCIFPNISG